MWPPVDLSEAADQADLREIVIALLDAIGVSNKREL
jgi:hypothetical protein